MNAADLCPACGCVFMGKEPGACGCRCHTAQPKPVVALKWSAARYTRARRAMDELPGGASQARFLAVVSELREATLALKAAAIVYAGTVLE